MVVPVHSPTHTVVAELRDLANPELAEDQGQSNESTQNHSRVDNHTELAEVLSNESTRINSPVDNHTELAEVLSNESEGTSPPKSDVLPDNVDTGTIDSIGSGLRTIMNISPNTTEDTLGLAAHTTLRNAAPILTVPGAETLTPPPISEGGLENKPVCIKVMVRRRIVEKLVFVLSVITVVLLTCSIVCSHWLLPYYYAVFTPLLLTIRVVNYWKWKWQYFLVDFCYFGTFMTYVFIWAVPDNFFTFCVLFALTNGPMASAIPFFRNSLVFHSTERMTSIYIHTLPMFLTYCIRWYPVATSLYWYKPFVTVPDDIDMDTMVNWLFLIPLTIYITHSVFLIMFVHGICKPGPEYLHTYIYFNSKKRFIRMLSLFGDRFKPVLYYLANWVLAAIMMLLSIALFNSFIAHSTAIAIYMVIALWNGSSFYIDQYAYARKRSSA